MDKRKEFIVFVILSAVGLVINELIIYLCQDVLYANVAFLNELIPDSLIVPISKIIATGVVMVYNFISRKIFLEGKKTKKEDAQVQDLSEGKVWTNSKDNWNISKKQKTM